MGLPSLRVQGFYLGFVTFAVAVVFPEVLIAFNNQTKAITGLTTTRIAIPTPIVGNFDWLSIAILVSTLVALVLHAVLRSSGLGRRMRVAGESPEMAATLGIRTGHMRILGFVFAGIGTGVAGVLYVPLLGFVSVGAFPLSLSVLLYFAVVVGGPGTLVGPIIGVYLLSVVPNEVLANFVQYRFIIYGVIAFVAMYIFPDGIIGSVRERIRGRFAKRRPSVSIDSLLAERMAEVEADAAGAGAAGGLDAGRVVLSMQGVERRFGQVLALNGVSIDVRAGQVHGLVGANGSGKTTLLNALSGLVRLDRGLVTVDGEDITNLSARGRYGKGIGRTFQTPRVFDDMSLWENLTLAKSSEKSELLRSLESSRDYLEGWRADTLPHAQRRMLELVRVVGSEPRIILLDEPAAGLLAMEREKLGSLLRQLAARGTAVVLVEHDLSLVWQIADVVTVMDQGQVVASGPPEELRGHPAVELFFSGGHSA
jgi:branched-chain amino acid transport system permease protein